MVHQKAGNFGYLLFCFDNFSIAFFALKKYNKDILILYGVTLMTDKIKGRSPNLDIIRIFALFCVVGVHFFVHTNFYAYPIDCTNMYIMTVLRSFFAICVPLFIILTGYLMKNKTLSAKFYMSIVKTLCIYLLASFANYIYRIAVIKDGMSVLSMLTGILNFTTAEYAWYVEMYIGLFLLIPFLNLIYNNLQSKTHKLVLIITLIALTSAPSVLNVWNFAAPSSFLLPSANTHYINLIPDWWCGIYPVTYYFIGCWLREYGIGISCRKNAVLLAVSVIFWGMFNIYRSYPSAFSAGPWIEWYGLPQVINATLVFSLLLCIKADNVPKSLHRPLKVLSDLTFGAYLMSWVFDHFFYTHIGRIVPDMAAWLKWMPLMIALTFVCSLAASFVLNVIYNVCYKAFVKCFVKKSA